MRERPRERERKIERRIAEEDGRDRTVGNIHTHTPKKRESV